MRKTLSAALSAILLCTLCAAPAHALEYSFAAPDAPLFAQSTSDDMIYEWTNPNVDRSKNAAFIPPVFGTAASYLPGSGTALTPAVQQVGTAVVNGSAVTVVPPSAGEIYSTSISTEVTGFTEVTSGFYYSDGSLGTLKIPSIGLTVKVFEGTGSAPLLKGAGHFTGTSIWDGNVAVAGHNRGVRNDFGKLHTLKSGDIISFTTALGTRTYAVSSVTKISVNDTSGLSATVNNQLTLYTCVENQPAYRWCVQATEVTA